MKTSSRLKVSSIPSKANVGLDLINSCAIPRTSSGSGSGSIGEGFSSESS
ncbi:MAG: hypothetical protein IIA82_07675 [Thaumarchaeota archaeon]|nr:hypothetical protein [Nitrososphaerota archaeon]